MVQNFSDFYEEYYESQFQYYDQKAISNKKYHRVMKLSQITLAAILPVAVSLFPVTSSTFWKYLIISAAVLLIILESVESYLNYQHKWMNYRTTAEALRKEDQMYQTRTHEYEDVDDPEKLFIHRVMELTSQENKFWDITTRKAQDA